MKPLLPLVTLLLVFSCTLQKPQKEVITPKKIETAMRNGSFSQAETLIREYLHNNTLPVKEKQKWLFQIDKMNRIRMDFSTTDSMVQAYLHNYYDSISPQQMRIWEEGRALEYMNIDGKKYYFNSAARNLFRISLIARKRWEEVNGNRPDSLDRFLSQYIPAVVQDAQAQHRTSVDPVTMEATFTLTVKANAVPAGEVIRAWMPIPRTDCARQTNVQLLSANQSHYIVAPDSYAHKSIYMEKRAIADEPTVFTYTFAYTSSAECYNFNPADIRLYNTQSNIYQLFTAEQAPHILFSERIKKITQEVVGNEQNPYLKVKKIYDWIDKSFPWASAREYSTIDNIPEYVLDNRHGDCGQVSLLFITMARCAGIPAKWQSGWMMHPGNKNLHDWAEVYYEGIGWVPVDQSFGRIRNTQNPDVYWFYTRGIDAFRLVVNQDIGGEFYPVKIYPRSETVDFQRGEVEWRGGNLYFNDWRYNMDIVYRQAAPVAAANKNVKSKNAGKYSDYMLPYTDYGYRKPEEGRYRYLYNRDNELPPYRKNLNETNGYPAAGTGSFSGAGVSDSYPSYYQYYGNQPQNNNIRRYNDNLYRDPEDRYQPPYERQSNYYYNTPPYRRDLRNDEDNWDQDRSYPSYYDNSVSGSSPYFEFNYRRAEDRYQTPYERSLYQNQRNYYPPYRKDLREQREQGDPRSTLPSIDDSFRFRGNDIYMPPYTDYGYRRSPNAKNDPY